MSWPHPLSLREEARPPWPSGPGGLCVRRLSALCDLKPATLSRLLRLAGLYLLRSCSAIRVGTLRTSRCAPASFTQRSASRSQFGGGRERDLASVMSHVPRFRHASASPHARVWVSLGAAPRLFAFRFGAARRASRVGVVVQTTVHVHTVRNRRSPRTTPRAIYI